MKGARRFFAAAVLAAAFSAAPLTALADVATSPRTNPPSPTPSPPAAPAIFLNPAVGQPGSRVDLTGQHFPVASGFNVLWDGNVLSSVASDGFGNLLQTSVAIPNDATGANHQLCVTGAGVQACAAFTLVLPPSPSPSASVSASPSPSPSPSAAALPVSQDTGSTSPLAVLTRPPFVLLPIVAVLGLLALLGLSAWSLRSAPPLGEVVIEHRAPAPRAAETEEDAFAAAPEPAFETPSAPAVYESPDLPPAPPPARPAPPPSEADIPPDLPEASD